MNNTILAILYTLNIMAFVTEMTVKSAVRVIALAIVLGEYTWEGAQFVVTNRHDIVERANIFRNRVGSYFVYAWFATTNCATCSSGTVNEHCAQNRVLYSQLKNFPMFDELWSEIADAPGEIFDVIEYKEEWEKDDKFDVEKHINGDIEFWWLHL